MVAVIAVLTVFAVSTVLGLLAVFTGSSVLGVMVVSPRRRMLAVGGSVLSLSISVAAAVHGLLEGPIVDVHER